MPPNEVGPRDTTPEGTDTTSTPAPIRTSSQTHSNGSRLRWESARRLPPLAPCGCVRDPAHDRHRCHALISDRMVEAGAQAARHILGHGCTPILDRATLRALYQRGGHDRALAQRLRELAG